MSFDSAFITGASSGLGRGLALHYAKAGATVFAAARRRAELDALAAEVNGGGKGKIVPVTLDVGDLNALAEAIRAAEEASGGALDLVIANAGIGKPTDGRSLDWREIERIFHINTNACCATVSAALPAMVKKGRGTVVAVSSLVAFRGLPANAAYCASKAAVQLFMEGLRVDLRSTNVRALTVYPGFVKTELTAKNKFKMPFLMELDDAVRAMTRGIERGHRSIAFPLPMVLGTKWLQSLPAWLWEWMGARVAPEQRR